MRNKILQVEILFSFIAWALFLMPKAQSQTDENYFHLEVVDSLQVDILARSPSIQDINSKTGEFLIIESQKLWIVSPDGQVKREWSKIGNGPDEVRQILSAEFFEDKIALMERMQVKLFTRDFEFLKLYKASYPSNKMICTGCNHLMEFEKDDESQLVSFFGPQTEFIASQKEYYDNFNIVDLISPNKNLDNPFEPIGQLEDGSRFLNGRAYYDMIPKFDVKKDCLFYALQKDTKLYVLQLPSGKLVKSYDIPFDEYIPFEGYSLGREGYAEQNKPQDEAGGIYEVLKSGDKEVIIYTSGLMLSVLEQLDRKSPDWLSRFRKLNYTKHLIIKDGKRLNKETRLNNEYLQPHYADEDGFLWARQNISLLKEEPDVVTFYKIKIVPDDQ